MPPIIADSQRLQRSWPGFVTKTLGTTDRNQARYHNAVNEIYVDNDHGNSPGASITATIGANWADPAYDLAGNMTTIPQPLAPSSPYTLKYDAWNRLVEVKDGANVVAAMEYDGLGQRIVRVNVAANPDVAYDYYYNDQWQVLEERAGSSSNPAQQLVYSEKESALFIEWPKTVLTPFPVKWSTRRFIVAL
jgi:YD repeat-containing protein